MVGTTDGSDERNGSQRSPSDQQLPQGNGLSERLDGLFEHCASETERLQRQTRELLDQVRQSSGSEEPPSSSSEEPEEPQADSDTSTPSNAHLVGR